MEVVFVLVNPAVPENIGFSLRGLKTMGFARMRIVGNVDLQHEGLRKTAYGSHDLIDTLSTYSTLKAALHDVDLVVGTTSKSRTSRNDIIEPYRIPSLIKEKNESIKRTAIVFGSEENGLSKEEINLCHIVSTVPLKTEYPSLNLAQSVLIYAYELTKVKRKQAKESTEGALFRIMLTEAEDLLQWLEIDRNPALYQKMKDRLALTTDKDMQLLLTVINKLKHKFEITHNRDSETL